MSKAELARICAALGDPVRMSLLEILAEGEAPLHDLVEPTGISRQGVTKHLKVLEAAGLVRSERSGREIFWSGEPDRLRIARDHIARMADLWDDRLRRLKAHVEK